MNINNLKKGLILKNYKELCSLIEEPVKNGTAKVKQLNELECYISFHRDKNSYIIDEIYTDDIVQVNIESTKKQYLYDDYIQLLLVDLLLKTNKHPDAHSFCCSKTEMFRLLGMVGKEYMKDNFTNNVLIDVCNFSKWEIKQYYNNSREVMNSILIRAIKRLREKRLIDYNSALVYYTKKINKKGIEEYIMQIANENDRQIYLAAEHETLIDLNLDSIITVYKLNKEKEYFKMLESKLKKQFNNWTFDIYHFPRHKLQIIYDKNNLMQYYKEINRFNVALELNTKVTEAIDKKSETQYDRMEINHKEYEQRLGDCKHSVGFKINKKGKFDPKEKCTKEEYVTTQGKISNMFSLINMGLAECGNSNSFIDDFNTI